MTTQMPAEHRHHLTHHLTTLNIHPDEIAAITNTNTHAPNHRPGTGSPDQHAQEQHMPARIQRRMTPGWRKPDGARYVGRPTRWGNPYRLGDTQIRTPGIDGSDWQHEGRLGKTSGERHAFVHPDKTITWHLVQDAGPEQVVELYRRWLADRPAWVAAARRELAGRDLMCWCPIPAEGEPDYCHAAVLIELANGGA